MQFIDTHAHLYLPEFDGDRLKIEKECLNTGVKVVLMPNIDESSIEPMLQLERQNPQVFLPMMGLHPCSVGKDFEEVLARMKSLFQTHKFYGVGETGIDLYWDKTFIKEQILSLEIQINWAKEFNLPLILHVRDSFNEVLEVLDKHNDASLRGIFHCFTGNEQQAKHIISYGGFMLGIGGVVTYKTSTLPEVLKSVSLNHLVLETDSPYLPPVPFRGKRNESSYLIYVAKKLAEIYGTNVQEVGRITTFNAQKMFELVSTETI